MIRMQPSESCWGYSPVRLLCMDSLDNCYTPNQKEDVHSENERPLFVIWLKK